MVETGAAVRDLVDERAGRGPKALSLVQGTCLRAFRWQQLRHSAGDCSPLLLARRTATGRGPRTARLRPQRQPRLALTPRFVIDISVDVENKMIPQLLAHGLRLAEASSEEYEKRKFVNASIAGAAFDVAGIFLAQRFQLT